jgi:uncharacterized membrane protein
MVSAEKTDNVSIITLMPNRSTEWKDIKRWLIILCLPAVIIALAWFVAGVWIILAFAGLELGLLCYFMIKVCYQNYHVQQIYIEKEKVTIRSGINSVKETLSFTRPDCYLIVKKPRSPMENLELNIANDSQSLRIGEFLNSEDTEKARKSLINAGLIECSKEWWKNSKP